MTDTDTTKETHKETDADRELKAAKRDEALAQARLYNAQAITAEVEAVAAGINIGKMHESEAERTSSDDHKRVYRFAAVVDGASTKACIAKLNMWDRIDPGCDMEIIFNSPGGGVIDGMALFDSIVSLSKRGNGTHKITIGSRGYAASMAGILLQAGDHRWIGKESFLMIHEISGGAGGKIGDIVDTVDFYKKLCDRVVDIFVERAEGKITKGKFKSHWERIDWWMLSGEALKLGFVDEVK